MRAIAFLFFAYLASMVFLAEVASGYLRLRGVR